MQCADGGEPVHGRGLSPFGRHALRASLSPFGRYAPLFGSGVSPRAPGGFMYVPVFILYIYRN